MKTNRRSLTTPCAATKLLSVVAASLGLLGGVGAALADSPLNGLGWHWRNPLPQGNDLHALIHAQGQFVAVGDHGSILRSVDGAQWTVHNLEIDVELSGVAYGNGVFVAAGDEPPPPGPPYLRPTPFVALSADGSTWTPMRVASAQRADVTGVAFGNGTFVMVGSGDSNFPGDFRSFILISVNGSDWADPIPATTNHLFDVTFANGLFVAVGSSEPFGGGRPIILTSPDGENWTSRDAGTGSSPNRVAYGNGRFVAISASFSPAAMSWTSVDGATWERSPFTLPAPYPSGADLSFGAGGFVLTFSAYGINGFPAILTGMLASPDGVNWTQRDIGAASNLFLRAVAQGNDTFAAVGEHGNLASSSDGTNWIAHSAATDNNLRGVTYGNGRFVTVGNNGTNLSSPDGVNWTGHLSGTTRNLREVSWLADRFIAVGAHGTILRSDDGAAWTPATANTTEDLWDVASGNGTLVAVGGDSFVDDDDRYYRFTILSSSDNGLNWTTRVASPGYTGLGPELHGVAYGNGRFVAVGRPRALLTSLDGINWTTNTTAPGFYYWKDIVYGNGRFVAVGETTNALVSDDGVTWILRPLPVPPFIEMDDVAYTDGAFIAVGEGGVIVTSHNGLDWTRRHSPTDTNLRGVIFGANGAVIVGNNDLILQSDTGTNQPPGCEPLATWLDRASTTTNTLNDVAFGDGRFVAVGAQFTRALSTAGVSWSNQFFAGASPPVNGVSYGNGLFVGVTSQGQVWTSTNGLTLLNSGTVAPNPMSIGFGNGTFITVGTNGTVFTTTNGLIAVPRVSGTTNLLASVVYGDGRFVVVGNNGTTLVSTNKGTNWMPGVPATTAHLADVTFGNGLFVAVGPGGALLTSADGLTWTSRDSDSAANLTGVTFGGGYFVAVGNTPEADDGLTISTDGFLWTARGLPKTSSWNDVAFGNGSFIVVGSGGGIRQSVINPAFLSQPQSHVVCASDPVSLTASVLASCPLTYQWQRNGFDLPGATNLTLKFPETTLEDAGAYVLLAFDGAHTQASATAMLQVNLCRALDRWTQRAPASGTNTLSHLACGDGLLVAFGSAGAIARSADGTNWLLATTGTSTALLAMTYANEKWIAVGTDGTILTSSDAADWTLRDSGINLTLDGIAFGNGAFVAVGELGLVLTSSDGVAWTPQDSGTNRTLLNVTFAAGQFVAVGAGGIIITSPDGVSWTSRPSGVNLSLFAVAWGNGAFVTVGTAGTILRSTNGIDWIRYTAPVPTLHDVTFAVGQFVAAGGGGVILSSPDGVTWAQRMSGTNVPFNEVIWCDNRFVAVGVNGFLMQSAFTGPPRLSGALGSAGFELDLVGEIGATYRLQAAPTLPTTDWLTLQTFTNTHAFTTLLDATTTNSPQRFYRVVSP